MLLLYKNDRIPIMSCDWKKNTHKKNQAANSYNSSLLNIMYTVASNAGIMLCSQALSCTVYRAQCTSEIWMAVSVCCSYAARQNPCMCNILGKLNRY